MTALTFLRQNQVHIKFTEEQTDILEELVVSTANSKTTKEQIATFFKECYTGPDLSDQMVKSVDMENQK